jgi:putative endonuclease
MAGSSKAASDWTVYILRCCDDTLYTGIAKDLAKRLEAHRRGTAAKYTRSRRPVTLAYRESQPDRSTASKREAALRRLGRAGKLALIALQLKGKRLRPASAPAIRRGWSAGARRSAP